MSRSSKYRGSKRDAKGRFVKGCTHSRDYKTKKCRSKTEHMRKMARVMQRSRGKRSARASRTISRAVGRLRERSERDAHGYASGYDDFVSFTPKKSRRDSLEGYSPYVSEFPEDVYSPFVSS